MNDLISGSDPKGPGSSAARRLEVAPSAEGCRSQLLILTSPIPCFS